MEKLTFRMRGAAHKGYQYEITDMTDSEQVAAKSLFKPKNGVITCMWKEPQVTCQNCPVKAICNTGDWSGRDVIKSSIEIIN